MIGGCDRGGNNKIISDTNIQRVTDQLKQYNNINIKSADIGDKGSPSAIVFDPKTGHLSHAVPEKNDSTTPVRMASIAISNCINAEGLSSLKFAFDFMESKTIGIIDLNRYTAGRVSKVLYKF